MSPVAGLLGRSLRGMNVRPYPSVSVTEDRLPDGLSMRCVPAAYQPDDTGEGEAGRVLGPFPMVLGRPPQIEPGALKLARPAGGLYHRPNLLSDLESGGAL